MVADLSDWHPRKVAPRSTFANDGIVNDVNDLHPEKAESPICATEDGMVMVSDSHSRNEDYPITPPRTEWSTTPAICSSWKRPSD